jgi:hypothetical protein
MHTTSYSSPVFEFMQEYRLHESLYVAVDRSLSNYEDSHLYNNDMAMRKRVILCRLRSIYLSIIAR